MRNGGSREEGEKGKSEELHMMAHHLPITCHYHVCKYDGQERDNLQKQIGEKSMIMRASYICIIQAKEIKESVCSCVYKHERDRERGKRKRAHINDVIFVHTIQAFVHVCV